MPTWENPEIHQTQTQDQAKQDDWPEKTRKKRPTEVIKLPRGYDSPSDCACEASTSTVLFSSLNKHFTYLTTFRLYVEIQGQGLATVYLPSQFTG